MEPAGIATRKEPPIGPILALVLAAALLGAGVSSGLVGLVLVAAIIAVESFTLWRR